MSITIIMVMTIITMITRIMLMTIATTIITTTITTIMIMIMAAGSYLSSRLFWPKTIVWRSAIAAGSRGVACWRSIW